MAPVIGSSAERLATKDPVQGEPADMAFLDPLFAAAVAVASHHAKQFLDADRQVTDTFRSHGTRRSQLPRLAQDDEHSQAGACLSMAWQWRCIVAPDTISDCGGAVAKGVGKMTAPRSQGFVSYALVRTAEGGYSVSVYKDKAGTDENV
jgi:hypothetical protein